MTSPAIGHATVAPREVHDLVYESCRVLGLDGGIADEVARSVTTIELWLGDGLAAFDQELARLARLPARGAALAASPLVTAPERWRDAELELGPEGSVGARFEPAAPVAALGAVLHDSLARGIGCPTLGAGPGTPADDPTGLDRVVEVELCRPGEPAGVPERWLRRASAAHREGLRLPPALVERVGRVAAGFLVSEAAVDAACDPDRETER